MDLHVLTHSFPTRRAADLQAEKDRQRDAWILSHRGHAVANGQPVLPCNRVGHEPSPRGASGIDFWGTSHVLAPQGEFVAAAGGDPTVLECDVDLGRREHVVPVGRGSWSGSMDRYVEIQGVAV